MLKVDQSKWLEFAKESDCVDENNKCFWTLVEFEKNFNETFLRFKSKTGSEKVEDFLETTFTKIFQSDEKVMYLHEDIVITMHKQGRLVEFYSGRKQSAICFYE